MSYPEDQRSTYGRRFTDRRRDDIFDDLEEHETGRSRIWTMIIIYALSAIVGTGFFAAMIWAFFKLGGGS